MTATVRDHSEVPPNETNSILAELGGHDGYVRIPATQQFTSMDRLRRTERALVPLFARWGIEAGGERGLATAYATLYAYNDDAAAVPPAARNAFIRSVLTTVFRESAARVASVLTLRDPASPMPTEFVIPNSGGMLRLERARLDTPATATMARSLSVLLVKDVGIRPPNDGQAAADDARPRPPEN
jgi:hypothetical protein